MADKRIVAAVSIYGALRAAAQFERAMRAVKVIAQESAHRWRLFQIAFEPRWLDADPPTWEWPLFDHFRTHPFDQEKEDL